VLLKAISARAEQPKLMHPVGQPGRMLDGPCAVDNVLPWRATWRVAAVDGYRASLVAPSDSGRAAVLS